MSPAQQIQKQVRSSRPYEGPLLSKVASESLGPETPSSILHSPLSPQISLPGSPVHSTFKPEPSPHPPSPPGTTSRIHSTVVSHRGDPKSPLTGPAAALGPQPRSWDGRLLATAARSPLSSSPSTASSPSCKPAPPEWPITTQLHCLRPRHPSFLAGRSPHPSWLQLPLPRRLFPKHARAHPIPLPGEAFPSHPRPGTVQVGGPGVCQMLYLSASSQGSRCWSLPARVRRCIPREQGLPWWLRR